MSISIATARGGRFGSSGATWTICSGVFGVCVAVTAAAYLLVFLPLSAGRADSAGRTVQAASLRDELLQARAELLGVRRELARVDAELASGDLTLRSAGDLNERMARIVSAAEQSRLTVHELVPGPAVAGKDYQAIPLTLSAEGAYPATVSFIQALRSQFPDVAVDGIHLSRGLQSENVAVKMSLRWHALPAAAAQKKG